MKKVFLLIISILLIPIVYAEKVITNVFYYPEGGSVTTSGFIVQDNLVKLTDGTYYETFEGNDVLPNLRSIKRKNFSLTKPNYVLESGKEWYSLDNNGKKHYFSKNTQYTTGELKKELGVANNSPVFSLDLHANWVKPIDYNEQKPVKKVTIDRTSHTLEEGESYQLKVSVEPNDAYNKSVSWSSSDSKIVSVNGTGVIKGIKKGTATITVKSKDGKTANCKVTVTAKKSKKRVYFQYNANGGKLAKTHMKEITLKNGSILYKNQKVIHSLLYGNSLAANGLANYNNPNSINLIRDNYIIVLGSEWNTKPDGSGKTYSQSKAYKASDFCDASKKDCTVVLYANWKKANSVINITLNTNGGRLVNPHHVNVTVSNGGVVSFNGVSKFLALDYKTQLPECGLSNYDNPEFLNIEKSGYTITRGEEWNTKPDGTGKSYSQYTRYKGVDFCSNPKGCNITLYANWKKSTTQPNPQKKIDVVLMFGQSNMVGRPAALTDVNKKIKDTRKIDERLYNTSDNTYDDDLLKNYNYIFGVNYTIPKSTAYEYKYNSNSFADLYNNGKYLKNFGETIVATENNATSFKTSFGTNIIPYFAKTYTQETGHKLAIVHTAIGGKQIECFLPTTDKYYSCDRKRYMYEMMYKKYQAALRKLKRNGYTVENTFYLVIQGEANTNNGKNNGYENYYSHYMRLHNYLKKNFGLKFGAIVYTAYKPSTSKDSKKCVLIDGMHNAQANLIKKNKDIILASDFAYRRYTENYANAFGLGQHTYTENGKKVIVKDNSAHYTSLTLSKIGIDSALRISKLIKNPNMDTSNTGYTKKCK